jgi:hypothetical protein
MTQETMRTREPAGPRYEARDADVRRLLQIGLSLCVVIVVALFGVAKLMAYLTDRLPSGPQVSPLAAGVDLAPRPRLQITPRLDLAEKRKAEDATLNSYGWIDRTSRMVRIPIERAMDLLAERSKTDGDLATAHPTTNRASDRRRVKAR